MRKHGRGRRPALAIAMFTAVLVTSVAGSAFAGVPGSKTEAGGAVWLVDYTDRGDCTNNSVNTSDNLITGDYAVAGVWVKSAELVADPNAFAMAFQLVDKGNNEAIVSDYLIDWGITCGVYRLYRTNQFPSTLYYGSLTLKVSVAGKTFGNDSAHFGFLGQPLPGR